MPVKFGNAAGVPTLRDLSVGSISKGVSPIIDSTPLSKVHQFNPSDVRSSVRHLHMNTPTSPHEIRMWILRKNMPLPVHKPKPHMWLDGEKICHLIPEYMHPNKHDKHDSHDGHDERDDEDERHADLELSGSATPLPHSGPSSQTVAAGR